jgi:hypothetical protein
MARLDSSVELIKKLLKLLFFLSLVFSLDAVVATAQVNLTGFIRNYNAIQHQPDHEILIGRNRLRIDLIRPFNKGEIVISNDVQNLYSASTDSLAYTLREAYIDLYFKNSDLRLGRQIIVWGRAEGTFITDLLTPVDLSEFLTQDFADIRQGVTAINYTHYFGSDFLQLVINPVFRPNDIPEAESRWFPRQIIPTDINTIYKERQARPRLGNMQLAARYGFRSNLKYDLNLSLLYWHDPNPVYDKDIITSLGPDTGSLELTETFTQTFIAAYSGTVKLTDRLLLTSESAYYNRKSYDYLSSELQELDLQSPGFLEQIQIAQIFNQNTDGFIKKKPTLISMIGLQYEVLDITLSAQVVNEHIFRYDSTILQEQNYYYGTLLARRSFFRDTWGFRIFNRYNVQGKDFWINPELTYTGIDSFQAAVGSQIFGGQEPEPFYGHLSFKSYASNSFAYLTVSAFF